MFAMTKILRKLPACLVLPAAFLLSQPIAAQEPDQETLVRVFSDSLAMEETRISLVTCEPFDKVYSLYGHTGLRIRREGTGVDLLANWGIFDMSRSFFILRFTLGLTDYRMDIEDWAWFCYRYERFGCGIYEQELDLTPAQKRRLVDSVLENYKPGNRYYRYNYFHDNCTTRVRDIVEASLGGEIKYPAGKGGISWRGLIHEWNDTHLWARWGNDFLLGIPADGKTTDRQAQFLPFNLSRDFDGATVASGAGGERKLVKNAGWVVPRMYDRGKLTFLTRYVTSPTGAVMGYFVLLVVVYALEIKLRRRFWGFDALVMLFTGITGLLLFVMIFSRHPAVSLNAQILVYNPLALVFLFPVLSRIRRGRGSRCLTVLAVMAGLGVIAGALVQRFSEGTITLALFLIMTYMRRTGALRNERKS